MLHVCSFVRGLFCLFVWFGRMPKVGLSAYTLQGDDSVWKESTVFEDPGGPGWLAKNQGALADFLRKQGVLVGLYGAKAHSLVFIEPVCPGRVGSYQGPEGGGSAV